MHELCRKNRISHSYTYSYTKLYPDHPQPHGSGSPPLLTVTWPHFSLKHSESLRTSGR